MYEHLLKTCEDTGFKIKKVPTESIVEKLVLGITCDHNDGDYIYRFTKFDSDNFDLEETFKVLSVLAKLISKGKITRHIVDMWCELSDDDQKVLYEYDKKYLTPNEIEFLKSKDIDIDEIDEYYLSDSSLWNIVSKIIKWFPIEYDMVEDRSDLFNGCHSLISIKLQYFDTVGNIFDITLEK